MITVSEESRVKTDVTETKDRIDAYLKQLKASIEPRDAEAARHTKIKRGQSGSKSIGLTDATVGQTVKLIGLVLRPVE